MEIAQKTVLELKKSESMVQYMINSMPSEDFWRTWITVNIWKIFNFSHWRNGKSEKNDEKCTKMAASISFNIGTIFIKKSL